MKQVILFVMLNLLLLCPSVISALPIGDAPYPPYPPAQHADGSWEHLGADWNADDGISWTHFSPGQSTEITFIVNAECGDNRWFRLWVDWNQSGNWEDDELMISLEDHWFDTGLTTLTETIIVPSGALLGETWLRARLFYFDGEPYDASEAGPDYWYTEFGEVEDYAANVGPEPGTFLLLATGLAGMAGYTRMRFRRKSTSK